MTDFARFDTRHYPTVSVREGYRDWLPSYEITVQDAMDCRLLEQISSVPWNRMKRVADLGCGTGRTGAWLRAKGATGIDGVDLTPEMVGAARDKRVYDRVLEGNVETTGLSPCHYDLVTCCLVDEHLPALTPLYGEAARILVEGGFFVLVGYHPFFIMASGIPTHFDHPTRGPVAVETHLHLLSEHTAAGLAAGLRLVEMREALIDDEWVSLKPRWERYRDWPISFALVWADPCRG
jgi:SAM-dependent methyltransferase